MSRRELSWGSVADTYIYIYICMYIIYNYILITLIYRVIYYI